MTLEHEHSVQAIHDRLAAENRPNYLRDWVYGGIDGAITTFAIVAGVVGAGLSAKIIFILGLANLIADGFSMAASNYSGTKTEVDELERFKDIEKKHIAQNPDGEREEIRQIYQAKGLTGEGLEATVTAITSNKKVWIDTMLAEEYGLSIHLRSPFMSGLSTFLAFLIFGTIPLLPYFIGLENAFEISMTITVLAFFVIGAIKSKWAMAAWWRSGLETLLIGGAASVLAYYIGYYASLIAG